VALKCEVAHLTAGVFTEGLVTERVLVRHPPAPARALGGVHLEGDAPEGCLCAYQLLPRHARRVTGGNERG
jgi:hypothetical protein